MEAKTATQNTVFHAADILQQAMEETGHAS
jgi:hypothetical protein